MLKTFGSSKKVNKNTDASCNERECFDLCINPNTRLWKPVEGRCEYEKPFGKTKEECVENCKKMGPNCSSLECLEKCNSCEDHAFCQWKEEEKNNQPNVSINNKVQAPIIKVEQFDGGVILHWNMPEDEHIKAFLISYFPLREAQKGKHMRVVKIHEDKEYKERINGLNENKFYNFEVRSFSDQEDLSEKSNSIVVKPQKYNTEVPREDIIVGNFPDCKFCNI